MASSNPESGSDHEDEDSDHGYDSDRTPEPSGLNSRQNALRKLADSVSKRPPDVLEGRTVKSVAKYMLSEKCKKVIVLAGAGISTSAGIPDFRSPETGLYANLQKYNLPYPQAVFAIDFFRENPKPFFALAKELQPANFKPTPTHHFIALLHSKSLLDLCLTQNIDTLERAAGLPGDKMVEAHGSFASNSCIERGCKQSFPNDKMKRCIDGNVVPKCPHCGGLVKPDIVFFGEGLPERFFSSMPLVQSADLVIILGTSLTVFPFAALPEIVPESVPRVLINLEQVGDLGTNVNDVLLLGECDKVVKNLCEELGWGEELAKRCGVEYVKPNADSKLEIKTKTKEEADAEASAKIEAIAREVEEKLKLDDSHKEKIKATLASRPKADEDPTAYQEDYGLEYDSTKSAPAKNGEEADKVKGEKTGTSEREAPRDGDVKLAKP